MAKVHAIKFKHIHGSLKMIPGVLNKEDLKPRMIQEVIKHGGKERPVFKLDETFEPKIILQDEEIDVKLTEKEKKLPEKVQELILARRAEEVDFRIRANEMLKAAVKSFEDRGAIKVLDWDYIIDSESPEAKGSVIRELSPIAMADMEDRGIPIPEHMKKTSMAAVSTDKSDVQVKQGLSKKIKSE